jgi:hypothetical protein
MCAINSPYTTRILHCTSSACFVSCEITKEFSSNAAAVEELVDSGICRKPCRQTRNNSEVIYSYPREATEGLVAVAMEESFGFL